MSAIKLIEPSEPAHFDAARRLFREYIDFLLPLADMHMNMDLKNLDQEIGELEQGMYAWPHGAIILAQRDDEFVGVVALRPCGDGICEMKRLYVQPASRGGAVGRLLAEAIVQKGREMGYKKMRLDTHPSMKGAHRLYYSLGFYEIERYNENLVPGVVYMELVY
jgi:putative acetyltransferase